MFIFSLILISVSSYLLTSALTKKNTGVLYFFLIAFAQIILIFEILSLSNSIAKTPFLILNGFFLICSIIVFYKRKNLFIPQGFKEEFNRIKNTLELDKSLYFLSIIFICFLILSFINIFLIPISFADVLNYYLTRCTTWIQNGNINHFITMDPREIIMPVNMDFLYTWLLLFNKTEKGIGIFPFIAFLGAIYTVYNILGDFKFCTRKKLWSIFLFSSFALIGQMAYIPSADLFIGTLLLISIYLLNQYLKQNDKTAFFFSTLACALAIGSKTTAIIALPSLAIILAYLTYKTRKNEFIKTTFKYIELLLINFIIFSSYNYILNYIQFGNFLSCKESILMNGFRGGIHSYICTLTKYFFAIFDFSGIIGIDFYNEFITNLQTKTLALINATPFSYMNGYYDKNFSFNESTHITACGLGALGLLAFLPSLIKSFKQKNIIFIFGITFIFNILIFSRIMFYTQFNLRYLITFITIASPILILSYIKSNKNVFKWLLLYFMSIYLLLIPSHKLITNIQNNIKTETSIENKELFNMCNEEEKIYEYFSTKSNSTLAIMTKKSSYITEKLKLKGHKITKILIEDIENYDLSEIDYILTENESVLSYTVKNLNNPNCEYYDQKKNKINANNQNLAVTCECKIPFKYLKDLGFQPIKDIHFIEYKILEK
ncbi:MAG: glycosyltransferase family 39 protein [Cyanobacteria bacterium SIG29]|nr:glycosyltransferase family 39 protein [Cyanobacteria bacterium SIG29]